MSLLKIIKAQFMLPKQKARLLNQNNQHLQLKKLKLDQNLVPLRKIQLKLLLKNKL